MLFGLFLMPFPIVRRHPRERRLYLLGFQLDTNGVTKLITLFNKVINFVTPFDIYCNGSGYK